MNWLFSKRFTVFALLCINAAIYLAIQGMFFIAVCTFIVGAFIEALMEERLKPVEPEKEKWQLYVENGEVINGIKAYRNKYGTTLKEAKDIVVEYRDNYERTKNHDL